MAQHFLLSSAARTLSVLEIARMSDEEARAAFRAVRFSRNGGDPFCPKCGSLGVYEYETRQIFKCKGCEHQFSLTSGTIFSNRKMSMRDILTSIAIFVNAANGHAALHMSRELNCSYKTAFVLVHKLREVLGTLQTPDKLTGIVEIDGMWVGGHQKKSNLVKDRKDITGS
jgi:transposase-like protein